MTHEEAITSLEYIRDNIQFLDVEEQEAINFAIERLKYDAKVKMYGSELAMAYAEKKHDEEYIKELDERMKKVRNEID